MRCCVGPVRMQTLRWGCGIIVALFGVIVLVGALLTGGVEQTQRAPVPEDVPPAAATPAPDSGFDQWAAAGEEGLGIPRPALRAYGQAEAWARENMPSCNLAWNTLAGIGYIETQHGTYGGGHLDEAGNTTQDIIGPQLNGDGFAEVKDTDRGELDGDKEFDRAVGPMQFIPEAWRMYGEGSPNNIDAAAEAAARLLCAQQRDLSTPEGWTNAIRGYNFSNEYVRNVRDAAANYALGQRAEG